MRSWFFYLSILLLVEPLVAETIRIHPVQKESIRQHLHRMGLIDPCTSTDVPGFDETSRGIHYIEICIDAMPEAASDAEYLTLWFHQQPILLMGLPGGFPCAVCLLYNFDCIGSVIESIPSDDWDDLTLSIESDDNIGINRVRMIHNNQTVIDWHGYQFLGASQTSRWNLSRISDMTKLVHGGEDINGYLYWALRELGKDDGTKYAEEFPGGWCSEFASWVYRHNGWFSPQGSIGTADLRNFFNQYGRLYDIQDVYAGDHCPGMGDYLSMWNGGHSGILIRIIDPVIGPGTQIMTVEGGSLVGLYIRTLADIDHIGSVR